RLGADSLWIDAAALHGDLFTQRRSDKRGARIDSRSLHEGGHSESCGLCMHSRRGMWCELRGVVGSQSGRKLSFTRAWQATTEPSAAASRPPARQAGGGTLTGGRAPDYRRTANRGAQGQLSGRKTENFLR